MVVAIVFFWVMCRLFVFIYEHVTGLIALASAAGTVWAAMATWRAAEKAAESAQIARESMDATVILGRQTLEETQRANKRTAFENRYAVLLAQHVQYHRQLCDYLDTGQLSNKKDDNSEKVKSDQKEIHTFFNESIHESTLDSCFSFLTGHEIISRYMRTLYHLLKFVSKECVFNDIKDVYSQKNYTSPVRSTIRNDVLLLIAINSMNVLDDRAKESSYPYYQELLHEFDFFEHAIFMFPSKPNELFKRNDWVEKIQNQLLKVQSGFYLKLSNQQCKDIHSFQVPAIEFRSPLIMAIIIFKNPMRESAITALNTLSETWEMKQAVEIEVKKALGIYKSAKNHIENMLNFEVRTASDTPWEPVKEEILSTIKNDVFHDYSRYDSYLFRYSIGEEIYNLDGSELRGHFRGFKRNEIVVSDVEMFNGIEGYINHIAHLHAGRLREFFKEIDMYKVKGTTTFFNNNNVVQ
ncbi:putative phage abortive infection protein [Pectobacterium brasiliense]|uniref:putative phage abortive infection protein n=1 Tax=Pectobacterium brasiliense TaxID=180957 RepID=UPI00406C8B65